MADGEEEQFSLCWNNYNTNLSTGFHESLCRGDLVDVTLAAEGHLVQAHRLVLSVCSPYFQKMFTQMPANQHAFVFLKDVPHAALKDLIQFMYCGEVNVKQDALPTFISTAEALQIKGLTENGDSTAQTPAAQSTHIPIKATTSTPANVQSRPRAVPQRSATRNASYKMDSEDSSDDKPTTVVVQGQKRVLQRPVVAQTAKRVKTVDPLDGGESTRSAGQSSAGQSTSAHIVQVASASDKVGEPEFIDLPIETLPTKAEPDYGDEGEVEEGDGGEATYVEDSESYGDMKYDESYFTEGEDTGKSATASGFTESYTEGDTSANEAQGSRSIFRIRTPSVLSRSLNLPSTSKQFAAPGNPKAKPTQRKSTGPTMLNSTLIRPGTSKQSISSICPGNPKSKPTQEKSFGSSAIKSSPNILNNTLSRPGTSKKIQAHQNRSLSPGNSNQTPSETKFLDGYTYEKRATTNESILWQCIALGCKAKFRVHKDNFVFWEVKDHNHIANVERITKSKRDVKFEKGKLENSEILLIDGHKFYSFGRKGQSQTKNWKCRLFQRLGCKAKCVTYNNGEYITFVDLDHNHGTTTGTYQKPKHYLPVTKEEKD